MHIHSLIYSLIDNNNKSRSINFVSWYNLSSWLKPNLMASSKIYGIGMIQIDVNIIRRKLVRSANFVQQNEGISFTELLMHLAVWSIKL